MKTARHPNVPFRRLALSDERREVQIGRGLYTTQGGERLALPFDELGVPQVFLDRKLWRESDDGIHRPGADFRTPNLNPWQQRVIAAIRDNLWNDFPAFWYKLTLGHDLHVSTYGNLYGKHFHTGWANPFHPELIDAPLDPWFLSHPDQAKLHKLHGEIAGLSGIDVANAWLATQPRPTAPAGFVENLGWLSGAKVTTAFVSKEIAELVAASEYHDFDHHEVGTSANAEANSETALVATTSISRVAGSPTDSDPIYQSVATITADTTEDFEEHGIFNNTTGPTMMDRNVTGGQSVVSGNQVQYTYQLTKNPEA